MKKIILAILAICMLSITSKAQDIYISKNANLSFFSKTPVEDIDAKTKTAVSAINIKTKTIFYKVNITSFIFPKKLMQEHFNENYMESERYPTAEFTGKILGTDDFSKDGVYNVNVSGKLMLHGVSKDYTTKATILVKDHKMVANSTIKIALKDHKIEVPKLVTKQIAETIDVTINAGYEVKK